MALITAIHPNDDMVTDGLEHYFDLGERVVDLITMAMKIAGKKQLYSVLDLPCGYGRVLRHLRARHPGARIVAAELNQEATDFCARTFGAEAVCCDPDPSAISLTGPFDLIWCGSLLTHLSEEDSLAFLRLFDSILDTHGLLLFTLHGRAMHVELAKKSANELMLRDLAERGYAFRAGRGRYGGSFSTPEWAVRAVRSFPSWRIVMLSEGSWERQDVITVQKMRAPYYEAKSSAQGFADGDLRTDGSLGPRTSWCGKLVRRLRVWPS
jgi:SAM-dependent methyltransferase